MADDRVETLADLEVARALSNVDEAGVLIGLPEQYTPLGIHHTIFQTAERIFVNSIDKDTGRVRITPQECVRAAISIYMASFNERLVRKQFAMIAEDFQMPDLYLVSTEYEARRRLAMIGGGVDNAWETAAPAGLE